MLRVRFKKYIVTAALALAVAFITTVPVVLAPETASADTAKVKITPEYKQTVARSQLALINSWRAGSTWYYNSSGSKIYLNGLRALKYDYTLEQYAMQRAAEIALSFDHTRPTGTTRSGVSGYLGIGENIAATTNSQGASADYALTMFKEEDKPYSGQGHRRMMLSVPADFDAVGIACVYYKGCYYWAQEFGVTNSPDTKQTTAVNGNKTMTVELDTDLLTSKSADLSAINNWQAKLNKGETDYLPEITLNLGMSETWPYSAIPVTGMPNWTSSNTGVATVNSNAGTITGVGAGTTNVTANETISGLKKTTSVTVSDPDAVTGVSLNKTTLALNTGESSTLTATVSPAGASNKNVTWSSSNTDVATVSSSGVVKGVKAGTATITARSVSGNKTASCKVTVTEIGARLSSSNLNVPYGSKANLTATVYPSTTPNKAVSWSSSNNSVATVDQSGNITAKSPGLATVTATPLAGGKAASCDVRVQFKDVTRPQDWFYTSVYWAADSGITTGTNGSFFPGENCTREQAVTFLWRMVGNPEPRSLNSSFSDVTNRSSYSYKAIMWASEKGIVTGTNGRFYPKGTCTREQIITILWRLAGSPEPKTTVSPFSDVTDKKRYSYKGILWGAEQGITTGTNGRFTPTGLCLRREIVTFLYRYNN